MISDFTGLLVRVGVLVCDTDYVSGHHPLEALKVVKMSYREYFR